MLFTPALSSRALRIYTYRILSLKHRLYSATVQPSLTASDQGPGSLTRVPSRASPGRGVPHAQPCAPAEVTLFLLWAFAGPQNDHQLHFCTTELFSFVRSPEAGFPASAPTLSRCGGLALFAHPVHLSEVAHAWYGVGIFLC